MHKPANAPEGAPTSTRCRPGDLAFIIHPGEMLGIPVTVLHRTEQVVRYDGQSARFNDTPHWLVRACRPVRVQAVLADSSGYVVLDRGLRLASEFVCPDGCLRPVRDGDGTDETLTWADKPVTEQVPA